MKIITTNKMIENLRSIKGATFATVTAVTIPKMKKTGNPFKDCIITKTVRENVGIGFNYENSVNSQLSRESVEAEFIARPRRWGKREDLKTVSHRGSTYLTIFPQAVYSVSYAVDGEEIDKAELEAWLPKTYKPKTQGTEKEIVYRDYKAESIREITMKGETYTIA